MAPVSVQHRWSLPSSLMMILSVWFGAQNSLRNQVDGFSLANNVSPCTTASDSATMQRQRSGTLSQQLLQPNSATPAITTTTHLYASNCDKSSDVLREDIGLGMLYHHHHDTSRRSFLRTFSAAATAVAATSAGPGVLYSSGTSLVRGLAPPPPPLSPPVFAEGGDIKEITVMMTGKPVKMRDVIGTRATLCVNVATYCALTPQYRDLVELYSMFKSDGLQILAFPCNQFGQQEPESEDVIRADVGKRFGVTFPIFDKVDVNGGGTCPLYVALKSYEPQLSGYSNKVNWNFEKFLLDSEGKPVRRYRPGVLPTDTTIVSDISTMIAKGSLPLKKKASSLNEY